jgi:hypothetical protein
MLDHPSRSPLRRALCAGGAAALACLFAAPATAQQASAPPPAAAERWFWGFRGDLGVGGAGGDFGDLLTRPVSWDYEFFRQKGHWRVGAGVSFGSFKMKEPHQDELEWGLMQTYLFGTRMLRSEGAVRPYVQARAGIARLRPRSELFTMDPLPPDFEPGQATTAKSDGFSVGVAPGLELKLGRAALLDASLSWTYFSVDDYDLAPVGLAPRGSGTAWEGRLGLTWLPNGDQHGEGPEGGPRDAWGVKRSYGWAVGEVLAINNVAGITAQYVRNVDWSETSPRSWWQNLEHGFEYDPDTFKTNQWTHPFNGAAYYNSSRSNGIGFWPSAGLALGGAFHWECCGEAQAMSFNDMFSTTLGGITLGEAQYRLSSEILDHRSRGKGRILRELGAFLVDPIRGVNRALSGDAARATGNPAEAMDWRPPGGTTFVATGVRSIGEGSSITHDTRSYATLLLNHQYGDVFENTRRKPFDFVDLVAELNFGSEVALGNVQIRGDLASWPLGEAPAPRHVLQLVQQFDYQNNTAYVFGGQSVGVALSSRFRLSRRLGLRTRVDAEGILLGAVNSEYARLAEVENTERVREYDYGPGAGTTVRADVSWAERPLLSALYRFAWLSVSNGSVYNEGSIGSDADHYIQGGGVRLVVPLKWSLGIGADAFLFLRDSHFALTDSATGRRVAQHVRQRNPQLRVYVAVSSRR